MQIRCFSDLKYEVTMRAEEMARKDGYGLSDPEDVIPDAEMAYYMEQAGKEISTELGF